jgi:hypothetical protein
MTTLEAYKSHNSGYTVQATTTGFSMRLTVPRYLPVLIILALALSACTRRGESPMTGTLSEDDDTFCRANNVAVGSSQYVACRKDRDAQRGNAAARADNTQRKLGEYMLNNPTKP